MSELPTTALPLFERADTSTHGTLPLSTRLRIRLTRAMNREYWPSWLFYLPVYPYIVYLGLRYGPTSFTAANPGISHGGGIVGESKYEILRGLSASPDWILPAHLIAPHPDPAHRSDQAVTAIATNPDLGGYPIILKPDVGQRGHAVKLARSDADVHAYFRSVLGPVMLQCYHPGPHECGILWVRVPLPAAQRPDGVAKIDAAGSARLHGRIFSITRKEFPVVTGDGRTSLRDLILSHPRYHAQASVFLARHAHRLAHVPTLGERIRLAESGNHCQGTLFADAPHLITPALESRIDAIASAFRGQGGHSLDICRLDMRYESDDALRRGESLRIIELNGSSGESGNIYDPARSALWAWRTLARQWRLLYQLGAGRRAEGHKPMTFRALIAATRHYNRTCTGPAISD